MAERQEWAVQAAQHVADAISLIEQHGGEDGSRFSAGPMAQALHRAVCLTGVPEDRCLEAGSLVLMYGSSVDAALRRVWC